MPLLLLFPLPPFHGVTSFACLFVPLLISCGLILAWVMRVIVGVALDFRLVGMNNSVSVRSDIRDAKYLAERFAVLEIPLS